MDKNYCWDQANSEGVGGGSFYIVGVRLVIVWGECGDNWGQ